MLSPSQSFGTADGTSGGSGGTTGGSGGVGGDGGFGVVTGGTVGGSIVSVEPVSVSPSSVSVSSVSIVPFESRSELPSTAPCCDLGFADLFDVVKRSGGGVQAAKRPNTKRFLDTDLSIWTPSPKVGTYLIGKRENS
ncbi:MAG: hypothetical protein EOP10_03200 [Proteobacteria bacterium]|nr:MAG: hypothetical protein EOP10_03200 [Pseudomonadota bacterium]